MKQLLAVLLATFPLAAQVREQTTVEVVQVPVYVTAADAAVKGLSKSDFELYINGKPQAIDYFDAIEFAQSAAKPADGAGVTATVAPPTDARQRRLYVLLFDLVYSTLKSISRAQVAADGYVSRAGENDLFAVATYRANKGIQLMVPFTRDRLAVRRAIQKFSEASTSDPLRLAITESERAEVVEPERFANAADNPTAGALSAFQELQLDALRRLEEDQIASLSDFADRLAPIEGNRHVVLFSRGFPTVLVHGGGPASTINFPNSFSSRGVMNQGPRQGTILGSSNGQAIKLMKEMYGHYTRAGVFLDSIDIEGNRLSFHSSHESEALTSLSRETGGQVILNRNDLGEAIQHLADLQRVVYVLGFHARDTGRKDNAITVKLRNASRGTTLSYRPSYSTILPKPSSRDGLRIADIVENDVPQTGMTVVATTTGNLVDLTIPTGELLALAGGRPAEAEALIYIYSGNRAVAFEAKRITLDPKTDTTRPLHVTQTFDLPAGRYAAKVLMRMTGNDAIGYARTALVVE
jgi:VWFA-related protein